MSSTTSKKHADLASLQRAISLLRAIRYGAVASDIAIADTIGELEALADRTAQQLPAAALAATDAETGAQRADTIDPAGELEFGWYCVTVETRAQHDHGFARAEFESLTDELYVRQVLAECYVDRLPPPYAATIYAKAYEQAVARHEAPAHPSYRKRQHTEPTLLLAAEPPAPKTRGP